MIAGIAEDFENADIVHVCIMNIEDKFLGTMLVDKSLLEILKQNIPNISWLEENGIPIKMLEPNIKRTYGNNNSPILRRK